MLVKVTEVEHYTERLFRFRTERPATFRFSAGEFTMVGIENAESVIPKRAYSITSGPYDNFLEFLSIKVQGGPLTSILQNIKIGDVFDKVCNILGKEKITKTTPNWLLLLVSYSSEIVSLFSRRRPSLPVDGLKAIRIGAMASSQKSIDELGVSYLNADQILNKSIEWFHKNNLINS